MPEKNPVHGDALAPKHHLSAHDLVKRKIEDQNFHITDEDLQNVDTSVEILPDDAENSKETASNLENKRPQNPYETLGE